MRTRIEAETRPEAESRAGGLLAPFMTIKGDQADA
jgi:hypothetical protein